MHLILKHSSSVEFIQRSTCAGRLPCSPVTRSSRLPRFARRSFVLTLGKRSVAAAARGRLVTGRRIARNMPPVARWAGTLRAGVEHGPTVLDATSPSVEHYVFVSPVWQYKRPLYRRFFPDRDKAGGFVGTPRRPAGEAASQRAVGSRREGRIPRQRVTALCPLPTALYKIGRSPAAPRMECFRPFQQPKPRA